MNTLSAIISTAMDLAGAAQLDFKANAATLYALAVIADLELQLSGSSRGRQAIEIPKTFAALARTGTLDSLPTYIRYRSNANIPGTRWEIIDIVSDIEDLTTAENEHRLAIMFTGSNPYRYQLSFAPDAPIIAELWGELPASEPVSLDAVNALPAEFTHLAANRTAIILLDDALLDARAAALMPFIQNRKQSLIMRLRDLEHRWTVYRSNADNSLADDVARAYDPFEPGEYGTVFEGNF